MLAAGFYKMMKIMHYETVVPGQDGEPDRPIIETPSEKPKRNPNLPTSAPPVDAITGPGIGDYMAKGSQLGPDLESSRNPHVKERF